MNEPDPVFMSLARLPSVSPRADRDARIRMRCHARLERLETKVRASPVRSPLARAADLALTAVLCGYAMIALYEAIRLISRS